MPLRTNTDPPPFIDVVNAKLPGQVGRMRADTVRGGWRPRGKDDRAAVDDAAGTPTRARKRAPAKKSAASKAATSTATAGATPEVKE